MDPAIDLKELPEVFLLTHNHYDHLSTRTIQRFPYKSKVLAPLKLGKYFNKNGFRDVSEMDWYDQIKVNDLKIIFLPQFIGRKEVCGIQIKHMGKFSN